MERWSSLANGAPVAIDARRTYDNFMVKRGMAGTRCDRVRDRPEEVYRQQRPKKEEVMALLLKIGAAVLFCGLVVMVYHDLTEDHDR